MCTAIGLAIHLDRQLYWQIMFERQLDWQFIWLGNASGIYGSAMLAAFFNVQIGKKTIEAQMGSAMHIDSGVYTLMEKMLSIKRFHHKFTPSLFYSFSLLGGSHFNVKKSSACSLDDVNEDSPLGKLNNVCTNSWRLSFSTMAETILVQARDPSRLSVELEDSIVECRFDDSWKLYQQYKEMEGFPRKSILNNLLTGLAESRDLQWLEKSHSLVELIFDEDKHELLKFETLIYLSSSLAKYGLPIPASTVQRRMVETEKYPPVMAWSAIVAHMSRTASGAYLAAELILEIGYLFQDNRVDPRKKTNKPLLSMKPNTIVFNLALGGCLLFGTTRKVEQLLEMMPRVGIKADSNLLITMAHIYEINGHRDELKKLKRHIDDTCNLGDLQYQQFYNCLLTCHLNFGDLSSASQMVLEMLSKAKKARNSLASATLTLEAVGTRKFSSSTVNSRQACGLKKSDVLKQPIFVESSDLSYEEFCRDRNYVGLEAEAKETLYLLLENLQKRVELVTSKCGILQPTEKIYAKLVKSFFEAGKFKDSASVVQRDRQK
ncbi:hypothetical protein IFM89_013158 [Coptis chinensis]|uniref:At1g68980-like TPR repeats domain-containing protein n=1 Tax=Coptis chinensis TaxID=261450 RepID=A0A835IQN0_9MAGN|nr:hypothetical protein IFM89_013158 [Coptis chinensis]